MSLDYEDAVDAAPSGSRKPFLEGGVDFKLLVIESKNIKGHTGNNYIVELRVLEAKATEEGVTAPPVGAERVVIIDLDNELYGKGNLMAYVHGLNGGPIGGDTKEIRGRRLRKLLGVRAIDEAEAAKRGIPAVPFQEAYAIGMIVGDRTNKGKTKGKGGDFTYHNWYTLKQTPEEIDQRKAAIKANKPVTLNATNVAA